MQRFILITFILAIAIASITFALTLALSKFKSDQSGVIVKIEEGYVTVEQSDGDLKVYPLPIDKAATCSVKEAWPDCLPKL